MKATQQRLLATAAAATVMVVSPWTGVPAQAAGATTDSNYDFVAKIEAGVPGTADARGCSGALIRQDWVITSAACFARNGVPITDGAPTPATKVTVGRPDLTTGSGQVLTATRVLSHPDRDVALVQLEKAVTGVTPIELGNTGPVAGEGWRIAGYGRTRSAWIPTRQHTGDFTVESAPSTALVQLTNTTDNTVCRGDTGGPAFREDNGRQLLMGLATSSGQAGCLGVHDDALTGVVSTRVDDLSSWISEKTFVRKFDRSNNDFNNDGNIDIAGHNANDDMLLFAGNGKGALRDAGLMWPSGGQWRGFHSITAGDFNNDGNIDIAGHNANDDMLLFAGNGKGLLRDAGLMWPSGGQWRGFRAISS
ncbi:trypsin-like serine protease [Actinoplanes philippinensis]|uniref:trypsin-like serine protease n=1 Tax=Actinoplanes philippinensis TaxID=35752 RepID=UPI0033EE2D1B